MSTSACRFANADLEASTIPTASSRDWPGEEEIAGIECMPDPVLRNLRVTWAYHEMAMAIAARTGPWINWCAMATWASRQAGRTIRSEDIDATVERIAADVVHGPAADAVIAALRAIGTRSDVTAIRAVLRRELGIEDALRRSSEAVSRGNIKVFAEIGREFSRFLDLLEVADGQDRAAVVRFCEQLPPGDPPDGKGWLRRAFLHQHEAMAESDTGRATQRQLLSNLEIGFHEQVRLQTEIAAGIDAPLANADALVDRLLVDVVPSGGLFVRLRARLRRLLGRPTPLDIAARALIDETRRRLRRVMTRHLMTLELPGINLKLGEDVPATFPPSTAHLDDPDLLAVLARIDPTPDSPRESGAVDWADFDERMHFICDLFRAWHESLDLLDPPLSVDQVRDLMSGRRPAGEL